jgi:hypothetical protein
VLDESINNDWKNIDMVNELGVTGASISRCPWLTWVDFLLDDLGSPALRNYACKGAGNRYISHSAMKLSQDLVDEAVVAVMFTNFDKFDQWVQGSVLESLRDERHVPRWINGDVARDRGYWCTGSHFPKIKSLYRDHYFDVTQLALQSLNDIAAAVAVLKRRRPSLLVMFDSPVLCCTEQHINTLTQRSHGDLSLESDRSMQPLIDYVRDHVVDFRGLIGHCWDHDLPWQHSVYGPHPPSNSHLSYYELCVRPWIQRNWTHCDLMGIANETRSMADKMTKKWHQSGF